MKGQINLLDEITVDGFCGGGGWSTGFELAIGRPVDVGINHDKAAIALHKKNHPFTRHYQTNIFDVDPYKACQGRPVAWAHFSPDCKHFSRAKGKKPVSKFIRSLAWVVIRWAGTVKPRIISMENVPEFMTWGPLCAVRGPHGRVLRKDGTETPKGVSTPYKDQLLTPDKRKAGRTFRKFTSALRKLGYTVEWKELKACDYGAPTSRKRFFLLARLDGKPIRWPEPTHGDPNSDAVKSGALLPWRTAAEIIDWSAPCPSIFERKKPLAENTLRRISRGIQKYIIDDPEPFIVQINHAGENFRGQDIHSPMPTITAKHGFGVVAPTLIQYHTEQTGREHRGQTVEQPLQTVDAANRYGLAAATLIQFNNHCDGVSAQTPLPTVTAQAGHFAEVRAFLMKYYGSGTGQPVTAPLDTITSHDRFAVVEIKGVPYQIADIGLRMLTPRELYNAQGFPADYEIETDCYGNSYPKKEQVARCGNAVPPAFATALARANWPEVCAGKNLSTMQDLNQAIAG